MANKVHHSYYCHVRKSGVSFMPKISVVLHLFTVQSYWGRGKNSLNCTRRWTQKGRNTRRLGSSSLRQHPNRCVTDIWPGEKLPLCGAYFPAAAWRSGYATGGRHSCWGTSRSGPVYLPRNSAPAVQGGRVSKEEGWKRNKQMQSWFFFFLI